MCESLVNVIKEFSRLYFGIDNPEPVGDIEKIEADLTAQQIEIRNELLNETAFNAEYWSGYDNGPYINREQFRRMREMGRANCVQNHRGFILSPTVLVYKLYPPFKEFLRYFPGDISIKDRRMRFTGPVFTHREEPCTFEIVDNMPFDPLSSTADEWIQFFEDMYAVDFGGIFYINSIPASEHYGRIASVIIGEDRNILVTRYQFDDWLEIMVSHADTFLARPNDYTEEDDDGISIVTEFAYHGFKCNEYFKSRSSSIIGLLDMFPSCLSAIIAAYITYSDLEEYDPKMDFDDFDHDTLLKYGMTEDLIRAIND